MWPFENPEMFTDQKNKKITKEEALTLIDLHVNFFKGFNTTHKKDLDIIKAVIKKDSEMFKYVHHDIKKNKTIILELLDIDPTVFEFVDKSLKGDEEVVYKAVTYDGISHYLFASASNEIQENKAFILKVASQYEDFLKNVRNTVIDQKMAQELIQANPNCIGSLPFIYKNDMHYIKMALKNKGESYFQLEKSFKEEPLVVYHAIKNATNPEELWKNITNWYKQFSQKYHSMQDFLDKVGAKVEKDEINHTLKKTKVVKNKPIL